jgi:hypothetical protein
MAFFFYVFSPLIEYRAAKTTPPLVRQCQKALNDISTRHDVGLYWFPGHAGVRGNEIADNLVRDSSVQRLVGPEPFLGSVGRIGGWSAGWKNSIWYCGVVLVVHRDRLGNWSLATGPRLLSFNRTQSRVVIGLLTGHNTLRRHLYIMGLCNNPTCRKCGTEEETSLHSLC